MNSHNISKVVVWGHKLHSHTHSYIHYAFVKAFKYLGYNTLWLDNNDDVSEIDFNNTLFITEGQVDEKIPIIENAIYILHNCNGEKYSSINKKIVLQVYTNTIPKNVVLIENSCYYSGCGLFIPWGTDLLPFEIDINIEKLKNNKINFTEPKKVQLVGMPLYPWDLVLDYCNKNGYVYTYKGGFGTTNISPYENMETIQKSFIAPAVQCEWQVQNHYIPCRIFKNISYGKMGITNNKYVHELFDKKIIYSENIEELMDKSIEFENMDSDYKMNTLIPLMEDVKNNHTYLNRIKCIFFLLDKLYL